jgi:predicted DNA-binding protein YlxM (UPF0122 family)
MAKVNLSELLTKKTELNADGTKVRKRGNINDDFISKMTPEECKAWRARAAKKRSDTWKAKHQEQKDLLEKAKSLLPEVLAYDLAHEEMGKENYVPKQEVIDKLKVMLSKNLTIEQVRSRYFPQIKDDAWHKLMKFVFKSQVSQSEDLGAQIVKVKTEAIKRIKQRLRMYKKEIKVYKAEKNTRLTPVSLLTLVKDSENELMAIELDVSTTLFRVGAVGEKSKSPSLHLHVTTPRPTKVVSEE